MLKRYWGGTIGAIELVDSGADAGFTLEAAQAFENDWTGNTFPGMLGNTHTQFSPIAGGRVLTLTFLHIPATLLRSVLDSFKPIQYGIAQVCSFEDGFQTITGTFKPALPRWYSRGEPDGDYVKDAVIRLIEIES